MTDSSPEEKTTVPQAAKHRAFQELQNAVEALGNDDFAAFGKALGAATKEINQSADIPYYCADIGGLPVDCIGPTVMLPNGHAMWLTLPEAPAKDYDFSVNFDDHLHLEVAGNRKGEPTFTVRSDEFPSTLRINDEWEKFTDISHTTD